MDILRVCLYFLLKAVTIKTQTNAPEKCIIEISFVLDASDSISPTFFNEEKLFINALVSKYTISSYGNKASVTLFSDKAVESIYCDQYNDAKLFNEGVMKLKQIGRYTNIEDGIIKGHNLLTKRGCGSRPNVIKIMIILTDGNANIGNSPALANGPNNLAVAAKNARDLNIKIYAVSIGSDINMKYLLFITNNTDNIIKSDSFDQLQITNPLTNLFPKCIFITNIPKTTSKKELETTSKTKTLSTPNKVANSVELKSISSTKIFTGSKQTSNAVEPLGTVNISTSTLLNSNPISVSNSVSKKFTEELSTASKTSIYIISTANVNVAKANVTIATSVITELENLSSTKILTRSKYTTPAIESLKTKKELLNTTNVPQFVSTHFSVPNSTSMQYTGEFATASKTIINEILTTTKSIVTSMKFNNVLSTKRPIIETKEISSSTKSFVFSSIIPRSPSCKIEVVFVLDTSDSISPTTFEDEKQFVKTFIKIFGLSKNGNKVSVVLFSSTATEAVYCDDYQDEKTFDRALENLEQNGQYTNIEDGINKGKSILQKRGCGIQTDVIQLMLIFTDGVANKGNSANPMNGSQDLANAAKSARDFGIKIIAIAVGKKVKNNVLFALTNDANLIIKAYNFNQLLKSDVIKSMILTLCYNNSTLVSTSDSFTRIKTFETKLLPSRKKSTINSHYSTLYPRTGSITTASLTTGSLIIKNSSNECNGFNSRGVCHCFFNASSFPNLDLSKSDIEAMFNGTCFADKLLASIKYVSLIIGSIQLKKNNLEACRNEIKNKIKNKQGNCVELLLDRFLKCSILIDCEMKNFYERAIRSKMLLENLVKFSEKSFDIFTGLKSLIKWFGL